MQLRVLNYLKTLDVCREKTVLQGKEIEIAGTKEITNLVHPQLP
ncbi:MAG: hypothetical protein PUC74_07890 [Succinatimonas sp.]|nr:hypothetical protein [Succinatimonas sp.]